MKYSKPWRRWLTPLIRSLSLGFLLNTAWAQDAQRLMRDSEEHLRVPAEHVISTMVLQSENGDQHSRTFDEIIVQTLEGDKTRLRFLEPGDIKGTAIIAITPRQGIEEQWLYLPAFRKTRQISSSELGDRFVGSDFFFEDLRQRPADDFRWSLLRSEKLGTEDHYVVEGVPANEQVSRECPYGKKQVWLIKGSLFPARVRTFDKQLRPIKEFEASKLVNVGNQAWRPDVYTCVDVRRKHRTSIIVQKREYNFTVPADTFSKFSLGSD